MRDKRTPTDVCGEAKSQAKAIFILFQITFRMGIIDTKSKFRCEYEHLSNYLTLHFRERRGAALLRFRNRAKISVRKLLRHCGGKTRHVFWKLNFAQESRNCEVVRSRGASLVCRLSVDHRIFTRIDVDESFKCRTENRILKYEHVKKYTLNGVKN